jgi:prevent-host-death family protein
MRAVRIAELKARLSQYLRLVRRGQTLTVLDRETPIARLVPIPAGEPGLSVRLPLETDPPLHRLRMPPPLRLRVDVVEVLLEERQGER